MRPVRVITAVVLTAAAVATGSYIARSTTHSSAAPTPVSSTPPPTTFPRPTNDPPIDPPAPPVTTLPLGHIERLDAVQAIRGIATAFAVGKGVILATSNGGRTWARVWQGTQELRDLDFVSAQTGWALGDGLLLGTADGGQHWRQLGQPRSGPLRQVHFSSRDQGWGVAGGTGQPGAGPMQPQGQTRLVHTSDGGRTWTALPAPAPPRTVCFTAADDGWLASDRGVWRSVDGGRSWRLRFRLPLPADGLPSFAALQCAAPGAAWVRFDAGDSAAGHRPYALYASSDVGAHWRGVLGEPGTLGALLHLPGGPGSYAGPFSVIDPQRAFLLSPSPAAETTGSVLISQGGSQLRRLPDLQAASLFMPRSVSFASATRGWLVGTDTAGHAVLLATSDGGRGWHAQLRS
jgi:hypothetical protein